MKVKTHVSYSWCLHGHMMHISSLFYRVNIFYKPETERNYSFIGIPKSKLGDNSIVFENFTASIGDLMVAIWAYGYLRPSNRKLMLWNFQIQYSYLHSNVTICALPHYWQDDVSGNRLKFSWYFNRWIDSLKITALSNHKPGTLNNYIRI